MNEAPRAPFGRPRQDFPEDGMVTVKFQIPSRLARLVYEQANVERRHLGSIATDAFSEFYRRHPPEDWTPRT